MNLRIPSPSLVVLIGASGSGKSTFARTHFLETEVLSSDHYRGVVSNDPNKLSASQDAFDVLHYILDKRLRSMLLTVVDATNVKKEDRKSVMNVARQNDLLSVAIVLNTSEKTCHERNAKRPDRQFGPHVVRNHRRSLKKDLKNLKREGFAYVYELDEKSVDDVTIERTKLYNDRSEERGPFDIVGDVHGCFDELYLLLGELGYDVQPSPVATGPDHGFKVTPPEGRRAIFVGDLVDRGPKNPDVLRLVMSMANAGTALCVPGNHDFKFMRYLRGKKVTLTHGLDVTVAQMEKEPKAFHEETLAFMNTLISHLMLDDRKLCVAHAGLIEKYQGRASGRVKSFCMYGETSGETDEFGLPVRHDWAMEYRGKPVVVYGHTPVPEPRWLNNTLCVDTGCVFGGKLTALRYPEMRTVSVDAKETYCEPKRPLDQTYRSAQHVSDDTLSMADVTGHLRIHTFLRREVTIRPENAAAALETISRFGVDPKWMVYLPPTMSPSETSSREDFLEHPEEAFEYYRSVGIGSVVCQQKHMGSRAIVIVTQEDVDAVERFGLQQPAAGRIFTRTGRPFFDDERETQILHRVRDAATKAGLWDELNTRFLILDCELMPWSTKAKGLIENQYGAVGIAARAAFAQADTLVKQTAERGVDVTDLTQFVDSGKRASAGFEQAYRHYCWPASTVDELRLAPFHLLATEGETGFDKTHAWHLEQLAKLTATDDPLLFPTVSMDVDLLSEKSCADATTWWEESTAQNAEGMVVKPPTFLTEGEHGVVQPAIKCRGREYLRIIYGPMYLEPKNLERLKNRSTRHKRSLALRESALGVEALTRFVRREPLRRIHECVFGVLALESEPVDPRL